MASPQDESPQSDGAEEEPVPVVAAQGDEEGEDSDEYDEEFEGEEGEEEEDEEDAQPSQSGLTALLLGNGAVRREEDEEDEDEEDEDDEYVEPSVKVPAPPASKKRGIEDVAPEDDEAEKNGDAKKAKA